MKRITIPGQFPSHATGDLLLTAATGQRLEGHWPVIGSMGSSVGLAARLVCLMTHTASPQNATAFQWPAGNASVSALAHR